MRCPYHGSHSTPEDPGDCDTVRVLVEVGKERKRQFGLHGMNLENESGTGPEFPWAAPLAGLTGCGAQRLEQELRTDYEAAEAGGRRVTWAQILLEEFAEVMREDDPVRLSEELIQVAAVAVSWAEKLRDPDSVIGYIPPATSAGMGATRVALDTPDS